MRLLHLNCWTNFYKFWYRNIQQTTLEGRIKLFFNVFFFKQKMQFHKVKI